jgi:AcrR family transcriptional regulator
MATALKARRDDDNQSVRRGATLREQQKQFTRDRLLGAALEVFAEDGYGPARVEDVAARAGASRATFYLHFRGKADLVQSLIDAVEPEEEEIWAAFGSLESRNRSDVRQWLGRLTELWESHRPYFATLEQAVGGEPEVAVRIADARRRRTKLVARASEARALLFVVQLERFCHLWLDRDPTVDWDTALDELASVWAED